MRRLLLLLLLVLPLASAAFEFPSCLGVPSINSISFTVLNGTDPVTCNVSTYDYYGIGNVTASAQARMGIFNTTHMNATLSTGFIIYSPPMPNTGNYSVLFTSGPGAALTFWLNSSLSLVGNATFIEINSTHYMVNTSAGNFTLFKNHRLNYIEAQAGGGTGSLYYPIYDTLNGSEVMSTVPANFNFSAHPDFYMSSFSNTNIYIVRSNFTTSRMETANTTNTFRALLYYQSSLIVPLITYFPNSSAFGRYYNLSDGSAFLRNNTIAYVYDEKTLQWFTVPALSVTSLSDIYTISVILAAGSSTAGSISAPLIQTSGTCYKAGGLWVVNYSFPVAANHRVNYDNGTTYNFTTSYASSFYYTVNYTSYPFSNYTVNGNLICANNNQSKLFGLPSISMGNNNSSMQFIFVMLWLASLAVSCVVPYGLIFSVGFNEVLGLISYPYMIMLSVVTFVVALLINGYESFNVKTAILYAVIIITLLVGMYNQIGYNSSTLSNLTASLQSISTLANLNLYDFTVAVVSFIINIFLFVLQLPAIAIDALLLPINAANSDLYSALNPIGASVKLGLYVFILIKAYEVIGNKFREV